MSASFQLRQFFRWILESFYSLVVLLLAPAYPLLNLLSFRPVQGSRGRPVVIIPDFLVPPLFYAKLRRNLIRGGFTVLYFPGIGLFRGAKDVSRKLARFLERYEVHDGILIAHGTSAPMVLALPDRARRRIGHLVSLGASYSGSDVFRSFGAIPYLRDFTQESQFIREHKTHTMFFDQFSPFSAWKNEWIRPEGNARFGQGRDLIFDEPGHYNLIRSDAIIKIIIDHLISRDPLKEKINGSQS